MDGKIQGQNRNIYKYFGRKTERSK